MSLVQESCSWACRCFSKMVHGLFRLTQLEIQVVGLAAADVVRLLAVELEIRLELAVTHLRV